MVTKIVFTRGGFLTLDGSLDSPMTHTEGNILISDTGDLTEVKFLTGGGDESTNFRNSDVFNDADPDVSDGWLSKMTGIESITYSEPQSRR